MNSHRENCVSGRQKRCFQSQCNTLYLASAGAGCKSRSRVFTRLSVLSSILAFEIHSMKNRKHLSSCFEAKTRKFGHTKIFRFTVIGVFSCWSMDYPIHIRYIVGAMEVSILYFKGLPVKSVIKWLILSLKLVFYLSKQCRP